MPKERVIAINGSAGAGTDIYASIHCTRMEVKEDSAATSQGLTYYDLLDGFTALKTAPPITDSNDLQIVAANEAAMHGGGHPILGTPGYPSGGQTVAATKILGQVKSKTATATSIRVREIE